MELNDYIKNDKLSIIVKPNSKKTKIVGFDENRKCIKVDVAAPPENGKANIEIIRFFSKLSKRKVSMRLGARSKEKLIEFR